MSDIKAVIGALPVYHGVVPENTAREADLAGRCIDRHALSEEDRRELRAMLLGETS